MADTLYWKPLMSDWELASFKSIEPIQPIEIEPVEQPGWKMVTTGPTYTTFEISSHDPVTINHGQFIEELFAQNVTVESVVASRGKNSEVTYTYTVADLGHAAMQITNGRPAVSAGPVTLPKREIEELARAVCKLAAEIIAKDGWIRGNYHAWRGHCTVGAIFRATDQTMIARAEGNPLRLRNHGAIVTRAKQLVQSLLPNNQAVIPWNDRTAIDADEVINVLQKASELPIDE